ncbi:unnamed protein product [Ceratitis capitata]|uniref:(Mediterranean fruit fly) hypothetical protein n=1 Tax=Ceratitis capitata TaxID=7213 RepID=A0A811UPF0_CERCA|nr:unnamed protein product [Ceratitis capitata]
MSEGASMAQYIQEFVSVSDKLAEVGIELNDELDEAIEEYDRQTQKEKEDDASVNQQAFLANSKGVTKNIIREFNGVCFKCGKREHIAAKCRLSEREGNSSQSEKCSLSSLAAADLSQFNQTNWCIDSAKAYRLYESSERKIVEKRDVIFNEDIAGNEQKKETTDSAAIEVDPSEKDKYIASDSERENVVGVEEEQDQTLSADTEIEGNDEDQNILIEEDDATSKRGRGNVRVDEQYRECQSCTKSPGDDSLVRPFVRKT